MTSLAVFLAKDSVPTSSLTTGSTPFQAYVPTRDEASPKKLKTAYEIMLDKQQQEMEIAAKMKAAADAARHAEVSFHDAVLVMKESVRGQFGSNSDEAQAIGYKKKSQYKRRSRRSLAS
ncbi:MAG: hypothetical protein AAFU53_20865 [Cyanobacteria bacterium J06632_3]